jgi:HAE1 family hydrophobic/amphiphilic exporter-1
VRLTQLFVRRPTLVVVVLALVLLAGTLAFRTIIQQQFPNIDFPVVQVRLSYAGAPTTEIRDAIVKPIEDAIAGAPDLDYINTTIQNGQATIAATFNLGSNQTTDEVEVQRRLQSTASVLPSDLSAPSIGTFDPSEATVATLVVTSSQLNTPDLSALVTNEIVPDLEQVDGIANVNSGGTVTPSIEVEVDPNKIAASQFTLGDIVSAISNNNIRAPGGIAYGAARETSIDIRGDVTTPEQVADLPLAAAANGSTGGAIITGPQGGTGLLSPGTAGVAAGSGTAATSFASGGTLSSSVASGVSSSLGSSATTSSGAASAGSTSATTGSTSATAGGSTASGTSASSAPANGSSSATSSSPAPSSTVAASTSVAASATTAASTTSTTTSSTSSTTQSSSSTTGTMGTSTAPNVTPTLASTIAETGTASTTSTTSAASTTTTTAATAAQNTGAASTDTTTSTGTTQSASSGTTSTSSSTGGGGGPSSGTGVTAGLNPFSAATRSFRIADVARVYSGNEVRRQFGYVGGLPAITLSAQKTTGASEITASDNFLAAIPAIRKKYPQVNFTVLNVQADYTQQQLDSVYKSIVEGIIFTGIVMLFFLRSWRNAIVVLIAIPTSLMTTLFVMRMANFTIDTISLLAMTLVIGILVDDSIVVLENTERHFEDGEAPQTAAILGRAEIGAAAVVITLVDVVVFLPISFLPGTVGRFLSEFGLVVVVATLTSLAVSFTITPALAGNWSLKSKWKPWAPINWFTRQFERVRRFYVQHALVWGLDHKWIVVTVSAVLTIASLALIPLGFVGFEFIPAVDRGQIFVQVNYPSGSPLTQTNRTVADLSARFAKFADVQSVTGTAGVSQGQGGSVALGSGGQITVFLVDNPKHDSAYWATEFTKIATKAYPDAGAVAIPATGTGGGNGQPIDYIVSSRDDNPDPWAAKVLAVLQATPGTAHVQSSSQKLVPQIDVHFDRERARALDSDIATAANAVRASFGGSQVAQFETTRGIQYVQVTFPQSAQTSVSGIGAIAFRTRSGQLEHVGDVATLVNDPNSPLMSRVNRQTVVHVSSNIAPGFVLSNVQKAFAKRLAALKIPDTVSVGPNAGGQQASLIQTVQGLGAALVLAFLLVYLLMLALYDSYRLPFIIMFAVPVASVGALSALAITNSSLNLFSLIGTVMLIGLVSKNGILLVDFANHRIRAGIDRRAAIVESAFERFRPIVMTTVSMIAGMSPIALALDPGSSVRRALGIVVIGGLTSSLLLTLLLVPVAFVWFAPKHPHLDKPVDHDGLLDPIASPTGASRA